MVPSPRSCGCDDMAIVGATRAVQSPAKGVECEVNVMATFFEKTKGHMGQYEDWWSLRETEDGEKTVVHTWSHTTVRNLNTNEGKAEYSVEEFLGGDHDKGAQAALRELIGKGA